MFFFTDSITCLADDNQEGVMDNLLEALKTGSCFNREKRDAKRKTPRAAGGELLTCGLTTNTVIQLNSHIFNEHF